MEESKKVLFGEEARETLLKGVNVIGDAVKVTLGAKGRTVIINKQFGLPHITKDGVSVAKSITLSNEGENMGAQMLKEVASKTADVAGDGTTTSTILAQHIINEVFEAIKQGVNPISLKKGIEKTAQEVVKNIKSLSSEVVDDNTLLQIATISANNDAEIGKIIVDAVLAAGKTGLVTVEESTSYDTKVEITEGIRLNRGYLSNVFATNNKMEAVLDNPYILVYNRKIDVMKDLVPLLEKVLAQKRSLLIMADDIDGEVLGSLILNKSKGNIAVCVVKTPGFGNDKAVINSDLKLLIGSKDLTGYNLTEVELDMLGTCDKAIISKDSCSLIGAKGNKEKIKVLYDTLLDQLTNNTDEAIGKYLTNRLNNFSKAAAVIKVGGTTEIEMKERKDRVDDTLASTKCAIEEGFVMGGGTTYIHACKDLVLNKNIHLSNNSNTKNPEDLGSSILIDALCQPFRQLLYNAGKEINEVEQALKTVSKAKYGFGYDVKEENFGILMAKGIIDPTKVNYTALENAVSIASVFLTTECVVL
jgi:chaperonin GroEL